MSAFLNSLLRSSQNWQTNICHIFYSPISHNGFCCGCHLCDLICDCCSIHVCSLIGSAHGENTSRGKDKKKHEISYSETSTSTMSAIIPAAHEQVTFSSLVYKVGTVSSDCGCQNRSYLFQRMCKLNWRINHNTNRPADEHSKNSTLCKLCIAGKRQKEL